MNDDIVQFLPAARAAGNLQRMIVSEEMNSRAGSAAGTLSPAYPMGRIKR
jgi:hypothetical protein